MLARLLSAQVVELVDALASGASVRKDVKVRVLSWAPTPKDAFDLLTFLEGLVTQAVAKPKSVTNSVLVLIPYQQVHR